jgi:dTMP kinase
MSLFITFEGVEGCGKSTQSRLLYRRLVRLAVPVLLTHEPGGSALGQRIARLLKWSGGTPISPLAELLLFNASRAQLVRDVVRPALGEGRVVICDRFADSTVDYQGYGRGLDLDMIKSINGAATGGLAPDLTVLLDMPGEVGLARKGGEKLDRFHAEPADFHRRVREGYLKMAKEEPSRWLVIDAGQDKDKIAGIIWQRVSKLVREL